MSKTAEVQVPVEGNVCSQVLSHTKDTKRMVRFDVSGEPKDADIRNIYIGSDCLPKGYTGKVLVTVRLLDE